MLEFRSLESGHDSTQLPSCLRATAATQLSRCVYITTCGGSSSCRRPQSLDAAPAKSGGIPSYTYKLYRPRGKMRGKCGDRGGSRCRAVQGAVARRCFKEKTEYVDITFDSNVAATSWPACKADKRASAITTRILRPPRLSTAARGDLHHMRGAETSHVCVRNRLISASSSPFIRFTRSVFNRKPEKSCPPHEPFETPLPSAKPNVAA
jgi:hypothetical protein